MTLVLRVENETSLPNGAPTTMRVADGRSLDIGRGAHLDWTLPDASRFISGKHCEIRFRDGSFWLYDVSTNGTFLNDNARRLQAPHRLVDGDKLTIGSYVIAVALEADAPRADAEVLEFAAAAPAAEVASPEVAPEPEPAIEEAAAESPLSLADQFAARALEPVAPPAMSLWDATPASLEREPEPDPVPAAAETPMPMPVALPDAPMPAPVEAVEAPMPPPVIAPEPPAPEPIMAPAPAARPEAVPEPVKPAPAAAEAPVPGTTRTPATIEEFLARFAKGAGIPDNIFARQDPLKVAEDMGALMRLVAENMTQLLAARFKAKRFARTANQTMIQALDNNPLKFAPTPEDALRIMFGPRTTGYLDARRALDAAFKDLKTHQLKTFSAMQGAVNMLVEDLDPGEIDTALGDTKSMLDVLGGRKARLWDLYKARWQAKTLRHEDGLTDAFMLYFAECYDRSDEKA